MSEQLIDNKYILLVTETRYETQTTEYFDYDLEDFVLADKTFSWQCAWFVSIEDGEIYQFDGYGIVHAYDGVSNRLKELAKTKYANYFKEDGQS